MQTGHFSGTSTERTCTPCHIEEDSVFLVNAVRPSHLSQRNTLLMHVSCRTLTRCPHVSRHTRDVPEVVAVKRSAVIVRTREVRSSNLDKKTMLITRNVRDCSLEVSLHPEGPVTGGINTVFLGFPLLKKMLI
jgi:hypothetical protein